MVGAALSRGMGPALVDGGAIAPPGGSADAARAAPAKPPSSAPRPPDAAPGATDRLSPRRGLFEPARARFPRLQPPRIPLLLSAGLLLGLSPKGALASQAGSLACVDGSPPTGSDARHGSPPLRMAAAAPAGFRAPTEALASTAPASAEVSPTPDTTAAEARDAGRAASTDAPTARCVGPASPAPSSHAGAQPLFRCSPLPDDSEPGPRAARRDGQGGSPVHSGLSPSLAAGGWTAATWPSLSELLALPPWMRLSLAITAAPIANPLGGLTSAANWMQQNELTWTLGSGLARDPSRWRSEADHWQARLRLEAYNGQPTFGGAIGSLFAPQSMAYPVGLYLSGLSLQRSSRDQTLQIAVGYRSIDEDFLVAPPFTSYLYSGFNDTLNLTIPGLPITPYAAPALVLHWRSQGLGRWSVGSYWLDQQTELAGVLGAPPPAGGDLRGSLQVLQWTLPLWTADRHLQEPLRPSAGGAIPRRLPAPLLQLGALRSSTRFLAASEASGGRDTLRNHAVFSSLTLPARLPLGLDNRFWGTVQWGLNPAQNGTPLFLAAGWQSQGLVPGRPLDVLSLGLGRTAFSPQLLPQLSWAGALELNYTVQINSRLSLQPVVQWVLRPSGDGSVPAIVTTALQLNLSL